MTAHFPKCLFFGRKSNKKPHLLIYKCLRVFGRIVFRVSRDQNLLRTFSRYLSSQPAAFLNVLRDVACFLSSSSSCFRLLMTILLIMLMLRAVLSFLLRDASSPKSMSKIQWQLSIPQWLRIALAVFPPSVSEVMKYLVSSVTAPVFLLMRWLSTPRQCQALFLWARF